MSLEGKNKARLENYEEILLRYLKSGKKPTRAVEMALEEYNNQRERKDGICLRTAWYKYKKIKDSLHK